MSHRAGTALAEKGTKAGVQHPPPTLCSPGFTPRVSRAGAPGGNGSKGFARIHFTPLSPAPLLDPSWEVFPTLPCRPEAADLGYELAGGGTAGVTTEPRDVLG